MNVFLLKMVKQLHLFLTLTDFPHLNINLTGQPACPRVVECVGA